MSWEVIHVVCRPYGVSTAKIVFPTTSLIRSPHRANAGSRNIDGTWNRYRLLYQNFCSESSSNPELPGTNVRRYQLRGEAETPTSQEVETLKPNKTNPG